ncbi:acyl carrier protein [Streptomyces sp. NPDC050164]|uniref:acyl carrier protein n=1 Tax=Streptomyces sp. NPDC050164 TaxID=3365605 RepID=UPI0037AA35A6
MFTQLEVHGQGDQPDDGGADAQSLLAALRQAGEGERAAVLGDHLRDVTARVLGLEAEQIGTEETLSNLGLDSMMAIEMKHRIEAVLQIDVSVLDLLQGATITGLSEGLISRLRLGGADAADDADESKPVEAGDVGDQLDELEQLLAEATPDELEALLRELEAGQR